jgi:TRAP-type C4-dicarboxylate transport system permease small subunit
MLSPSLESFVFCSAVSYSFTQVCLGGYTFRMKPFCAFKKTVRLIENFFCLIGISLFLGLMFLGSSDVIARYIFNHPITGTIEISQVLMATMIFLAWPHTQTAKGHITVEIILDYYAPRTRKAVNFGTLFLSLILFSLIVWQSAKEALWHWEEARTFQTIPLPTAPFELSVSIGGAILCAELIIDIYHVFCTNETAAKRS